MLEGGIIILVLLLLFRTKNGNTAIRVKRHKNYLKRAKRMHRKLARKPPREVFYSLRSVNPYVFEELILVAFNAIGFKVKRSKRYSGDGGVDGKVKIDGDWYFIQAKKYSGYINPSHVKDFKALCDRSGKNGFFIHTGKTGKESYNHVGNSVKIISGNKLLRMFETTSERRSFFDRGSLQREKITVLFALKKKEDA
jgi:restriction system protein